MARADRRLHALREAHGTQVVSQWQEWAQSHALAPLFEALATQHYDPLYERSMRRSYPTLDQAPRVELHSGTAADLADAAAQVLGLHWPTPAT